jgi:hypothetical protein
MTSIERVKFVRLVIGGGIYRTVGFGGETGSPNGRLGFPNLAATGPPLDGWGEIGVVLK